jgi:glycosyltransferase involved in cell wall biosynthesis
MRLLVCAQAVDKDDKELSFFLLWLDKLAGHYEEVTVLCLRQGAHSLPPNVRVLSLGHGIITRALWLLWYSLKLRGRYDAVFVHQGQEFVLAAGWMWSLLRKPVYFWRNHYAGSLLTDAAASFCKKIFCTSRHSYTAKFPQTTFMPIGIDAQVFKPVPGVVRAPGSVLFFGRVAPSKRAEMLVDALKVLQGEGVRCTASIVGSPLPKDAAYYGELRRQAQELGVGITFLPGVTNDKAPALYSAHSIYVNCSRSGMYDKTIFEAAACGCVSLAASDDWRKVAGEEYYFGDANDLARKLKTHLAYQAQSGNLAGIAQDNSLESLAGKLYTAMV